MYNTARQCLRLKVSYGLGFQAKPLKIHGGEVEDRGEGCVLCSFFEIAPFIISMFTSMTRRSNHEWKGRVLATLVKLAARSSITERERETKKGGVSCYRKMLVVLYGNIILVSVQSTACLLEWKLFL